MLTRRRFVEYSALSSPCWRIARCSAGLGPDAGSAPAAPGDPGQRVSASVAYANPCGPLSGWLSVRRRMAHAKCAGGLGLCGSVGAPSRCCALALPACDDGSQGCAVKCSQRNRGRPGQGSHREDAACAGESRTNDRFEQSPRAAVRLPPVQQHSRRRCVVAATASPSTPC